MKTIVAVLSVCLFLFRAEPVSAQIATGRIGEMVLSSVIHSLVGKGFDSIFGAEAGVTVDQLRQVLDDKLRDYRAEEIKDQVSGLTNQMRLYSPTLSIENRRENIENILSRTSDLEGSLYTNISNGKFWELYPDYLLVINIRLGFLAERALIESKGYDGKTIIVQEALNALRTAREIYEHDFIDHTDYDCVYKEDTIDFYTRNGKKVASKWVHGGKKACKSDRNYIAAKTGGYLDPFAPNTDLWKKRRVLKRPGKHHHYYYVYKRYADKDEYWLAGVYKDENYAKKRRVQLSIGKYPKKLGRDKETLRGWWRIVSKLGNAEQREEGTPDAKFLQVH